MHFFMYPGTDRHPKAPIGTGINLELHQVSLFKWFLMCYIYNGQSTEQELRSRVHFLLQKNTGNDERLFMTASVVVDQALFMPEIGNGQGRRSRPIHMSTSEGSADGRKGKEQKYR